MFRYILPLAGVTIVVAAAVALLTTEEGKAFQKKCVEVSKTTYTDMANKAAELGEKIKAKLTCNETVSEDTQETPA